MSLIPSYWNDELHEALTLSNQRLIIDCAGDVTWCQQMAQSLVQNKKTLLLSDQNSLSTLAAIPFNKSIQLLGQEFDVVIYDAFSGFDVDTFARACGLIKAPGLLILMRPDNEQWQQQHDAKNIWQDKKQGNHYFISYLLKQLGSSNAVLQCHQNKAISSIPQWIDSIKTSINPSSLLSEQQQLAWGQLNAIFNVEAHSIALIAARGRGKSTLLGRWASQKAFIKKRFIITSDSKKAAGHCLRFSEELDNVEYQAIDYLLQNQADADCIIVDEAAMIPVALLFQLKKQYKTVIYTSTLEGYEGTGQGFDLQFLASFSQQALNIIELTTPMRWGNNDLLEAWVQDTLMLNSVTVEPKKTMTTIDYHLLSQQQLSVDVDLLRQVFHLLKSAHYRTKASDLRMLMDNPDITLMVASANSNIVGVMLLLAEGGLDEDLSQAIYYGKRRPQGHLLAQGLTVHAGCDGFSQLKGYRVQRIAVKSDYRQQGIASQLIQLGIEHAKQQKTSYLGAVFALDEQRVSFWYKNQMDLMMVSVGQGTSTGKSSITMLLTFDEQAEDYKNMCREQLAFSFSERLLTHFKQMPASQVSSLLLLMPDLGKNNTQQCEPYINGFKGFEYALFDLRLYVLYCLQHGASKQFLLNKELLIKAILQYQPWPELISHYSLSGKKELNQRLKDALK